MVRVDNPLEQCVDRSPCTNSCKCSFALPCPTPLSRSLSSAPHLAAQEVVVTRHRVGRFITRASGNPSRDEGHRPDPPVPDVGRRHTWPSHELQIRMAGLRRKDAGARPNGSGWGSLHLSDCRCRLQARGGVHEGAATEAPRPCELDRFILARQPLISAFCIRAVSQVVKSGSCQPHCRTKVS